MVIASDIVIRGGGKVLVSPWWLVLSYLFQTFGELSLSPVGLSSMTKLAPLKFKGQMMGVWFMAAALGNLIAGLVGGRVDPEKLQDMPVLFRQTSLFLFIAAVLCGLLVFPVRKMMRGVPAGNR
jgi:POT family proton-dependent oligopeptide transporter